jgi:pimeloyl-ACP methyl ester carboxylesterase
VTLPDGVALRVCEAGPRDGPPALLLHGWGATAHLWRMNILPLAVAGHRVIVPDLPGHGLSDAPEGRDEYTLGRFVARMVALMDVLGVERAAIAAQSLAGKVAVRLALDHPERVASLALFGPVGFGVVPPWRALAAILPPLPMAIAPRVVPRWVVSLVQRRVRGRLVAATSAELDQIWAPSQFPAIVRAQHRMTREFDWRLWDEGDLAQVRAPVHVVFGTLDRTVRPDRAEPLTRALPRGRFTWVRDGGHVVMEESPDEVNTILRDISRGRGLDSAG